MKKPLVSVIVTSFNNAKYLPKCLDALYDQTLKDIEVICIDDASDDDSAQIIRDYARHDNRFHAIVNSENLGVSASRNLATAKAKADFIMYCDADDYYEPTMCEKMHHAITTHDTDLAICEIDIIYHAHPEMRISDDNYYSLKYHGLQLVTPDLPLNTDLAPTNKIFRKSLLKRYSIEFPEGLRYEDAYFCMAYFFVSKTVFYLNERLYHYVRHQHSTMSQTWSDSHTDFAIDHLYIAFRLYDFLSEHQLLETYGESFWQCFYAYESFALDNSKSKARIAEVKAAASDFIAQHTDSLSQVNPTLQEIIRQRSSTSFYFSATRLKNFLLRFMPTYRLAIENIHSLRTLQNKNQELLDSISQSQRSIRATNRRTWQSWLRI